MRAMRFIESAEGPRLTEVVTSRPEPGPGELRISVCAAGVTKTEVNWYPTFHSKQGGPRTGAIPCHEFSGIITGVGPDVGNAEIGHTVFGTNDWFSDGALADFCIAPYESVALKPSSLTHVEAASVPIGALTAWQGLFDRARLQAGERVLIHGGAGAVGVFAIQLAAWRGAHVIATVSARDIEFARALGVCQAIDYQSSKFEDSVSSIDVVFDTVGGVTLDRSWAVLKPAGRVVTTAYSARNAAEAHARDAFFLVEPNQKQLSEIAGMFDGGHLRAVVDNVVPFSQSPDVYSGHAGGQGRGKIVVAPIASEAVGTDCN